MCDSRKFSPRNLSSQRIRHPGGSQPIATSSTIRSAKRSYPAPCPCLQHLVGWPRLKPPRRHHTWPPAAAASVTTTSRSYTEVLLYISRHGCAQAWRREDIGGWEGSGAAGSPAASTGCPRRREWKWKETGWTSFQEYESVECGGECE